MRELIIDIIKNDGVWDYCFKRGDNKAKLFSSYAKWLESLSNSDLLAAYDRCRDIINSLD